MLSIFSELESNGNYLREAREQAYSFGNLGSLQKIKNKFEKSLRKGKAFILLDFFINFSDQTPLLDVNVFIVHTNMHIWIGTGEKYGEYL